MGEIRSVSFTFIHAHVLTHFERFRDVAIVHSC
jgi:hypothetical protein